MTAEALERVKFYVENTRRISQTAAQTCHSNGHHGIALHHENEAALAGLILSDLETEQPNSG
jgi:hypothetical protein